MKYRRSWGGDEWQAFALQLVQRLHGSKNVQIVPDSVDGDAGLEFFTTCGCLYQCYAPEETSDVKKAASAMKAKATRDLPKLVKYKNKIEPILAGTIANRWILLVPFLDNKEVVAHVRKRGVEIKKAGLSFIDANFEALCHSQENFAGEIEQLNAMSIGTPLTMAAPSTIDISAAGATEIGSKIDAKLGRAFNLSPADAQVHQRRNAYIKAHLYRENAIEQLRESHSVLWEKVFQSLEAEETRLVAEGATATLPAAQLKESTDRIETSLKKALPTLSPGVVTHIALGTVSDWLIRCPLDFPEPK